MIHIDIEKAVENAEKLKIVIKSSQVLKKSLIILVPDNKESAIRKIIFLLFEMFFARMIVTQADTVSFTKEIFEVFITILVAMIAIVFTGYAIFQALINDNLLIALLSVNNEKGNLIGTNKYFVELMLFQIVCTIFNLFIVIFTIITPNDWCAFKNMGANEWLAGIILLCAMHCNIESIWEMKSFCFNVFQLINVYEYARITEIKEKKDKA